MHSRAVPLSFEPSVLGAGYHWQKWKASSFSPWYFEHKTLPRMSDTHISVLGGGRLVRSRRTDVSVVIVYCHSMCSACTDSAVTGCDACTGRLACMCAACTVSAVTWCDPGGRA